jgi:hypothetical protein
MKKGEMEGGREGGRREGGREGGGRGKEEKAADKPDLLLLTFPPSGLLYPIFVVFSNSESAQIIIPASELKRHHDVYIAVISYAHMVAAQGRPRGESE